MLGADNIATSSRELAYCLRAAYAHGVIFAGVHEL